MFFVNINTIEELKKQYKKLVLKFHPDCGGNLRDMQELNAEYDNLFNALKNEHNKQASASEAKKTTTETPEEFRSIIEQIIFIDGIEIELCGSWLWVSGNTYEHKDTLKSVGFRWSRNKKKWYWHHAEQGEKWYRGSKSMKQIRETYGSEFIETTKRQKLTA